MNGGWADAEGIAEARSKEEFRSMLHTPKRSSYASGRQRSMKSQGDFIEESARRKAKKDTDVLGAPPQQNVREKDKHASIHARVAKQECAGALSEGAR